MRREVVGAVDHLEIDHVAGLDGGRRVALRLFDGDDGVVAAVHDHLGQAERHPFDR